MRGYNPRTRLDNYFFTIEKDFDVNTERIKAREKIEQAQDRYYAENSQPEARKTKLKCGDFIVIKSSAIQLDYGKKLSRKLTGPYLIIKLTDSVVTALHWKTQRKVKVNLDRVYLYTGRINKRMKLLKDSQRGIESNIQAENECPATERSISEIDQLSDNMGEDPETNQGDHLSEEDRRGERKD